MAIKFFKLGTSWNQVERIRETMLNSSLSLCPLYLTYKDHKGWSWSKGTPPPTRPIAAGNVGMNIHLSEVISEVAEAVANAHPNTKEVISTEDMLARVHEMNERRKDWTEYSWWSMKGSKDGSLVSCGVCVGEEDGEDEGCSCVSPGNHDEVWEESEEEEKEEQEEEEE